MNHTFIKAQGRIDNSSSKTGSRASTRKAQRESERRKRTTKTQAAGQPSEQRAASVASTPEPSSSRVEEENSDAENTPRAKSSSCCCCCHSRQKSSKTNESPCSWFLSMFGLEKRKKIDDFVVFDEQSALDQSLLWPENGSQPTPDDYLEFAPGHERGLAEQTSNAALPAPPEDRIDY
mmetsp:Transcript_19430/g.34963  ORF Transcript_19430/g.34963 Transcript_19430/m.34963 type:complete len:178 (+) Transcript_19430:415-948(+)|eukprot:CAMPEP_0201611320 /NCGR_PEP_ID=MMETSP0492-20130828/19763_1 /ASSEMBLY_ACC=CAM_ASM_000837 /TAXON_ID=420259 /ORGANISM="Thalassiosira gravida, Strain GMp14c1" /LENGTH=177 /DNA_ID=CAMNT_0048077461 /DNA_START=279 /DNA_END=812 /DNA_ORIENTATION=+